MGEFDDAVGFLVERNVLARPMLLASVQEAQAAAHVRPCWR